MSATLIIGDVFDALATIPDASVDLIVTSSPFLKQRSYMPADHPSKRYEIGQEATPGLFLDSILAVAGECQRVLAPYGSLVWELADKYAESGGAGGDYNAGGMREGQPRYGKSPAGGDWPEGKSLCFVPELFGASLAYGHNLLTGMPTPRWRVRNKVVWCKPDPSPGDDRDKFRPATSYLTVACTSRDRYFDVDAVLVPLADSPGNRYVRKVTAKDRHGKADGNSHNTYTKDYDPSQSNGRRPFDWWIVSTSTFTGAHFATWPEQLVVPFVESMCPPRVCLTCGLPSTRIIERDSTGVGYRRSRQSSQEVTTGAPDVATRRTLGWTDCGCSGDHWRPGVVLDPFCGSGTSLQVATRLGRDAIGIDLDPRNEKLIRERVGLFMGNVLLPEQGRAC